MHKDLIWVDKEFAEKYKSIESDEEKSLLFQDYLSKAKEEYKAEFKSQLENIEEDLAIHIGLLLKVKQAFEKAKDEQLKASYDLWEKFEKELPNIQEKVKKIEDTVIPLEEKLKVISGSIAKINTWEVERLIDVLARFNSLSDKSKDMMEFLVKNYKGD